MSVCYQDLALEELCDALGVVYTGRVKQRLCLVLDCLVAHEFSPTSVALVNLQHYVIREKKLTEREAAIILYNTVKVVKCLHEVQVIIW